MSSKKKGRPFFDYLALPKGQAFSKYLVGPLKDTDGDKVPDMMDCSPLDPKRDGLRDWLERRRKKKVLADVGTSTGGTQKVLVPGETSGTTKTITVETYESGRSGGGKTYDPSFVGPVPEYSKRATSTTQRVDVSPTGERIGVNAPSVSGSRTGGGSSRTYIPTTAPAPAFTTPTPTTIQQRGNSIDRFQQFQQQQQQKQLQAQQQLAAFQRQRQLTSTKKEDVEVRVSAGGVKAPPSVLGEREKVYSPELDSFVYVSESGAEGTARIEPLKMDELTPEEEGKLRRQETLEKIKDSGVMRFFGERIDDKTGKRVQKIQDTIKVVDFVDQNVASPFVRRIEEGGSILGGYGITQAQKRIDKTAKILDIAEEPAKATFDTFGIYAKQQMQERIARTQKGLETGAKVIDVAEEPVEFLTDYTISKVKGEAQRRAEKTAKTIDVVEEPLTFLKDYTASELKKEAERRGEKTAKTLRGVGKGAELVSPVVGVVADPYLKDLQKQGERTVKVLDVVDEKVASPLVGRIEGGGKILGGYYLQEGAKRGEKTIKGVSVGVGVSSEADKIRRGSGIFGKNLMFEEQREAVKSIGKGEETFKVIGEDVSVDPEKGFVGNLYSGTLEATRKGYTELAGDTGLAKGIFEFKQKDPREGWIREESAGSIWTPPTPTKEEEKKEAEAFGKRVESAIDFGTYFTPVAPTRIALEAGEAQFLPSSLKTEDMPKNAVDYFIKNPEEALFLGTLGAFKGAGALNKLSKVKKIKRTGKVEKEIAEELKKLEKVQSKELTIIKKGEGGKIGSDKVEVIITKKTDNFLQEIKYVGDLIKKKDGLYLFPEAKGTSTIKGRFKPEGLRERRIVEVQSFEIGARGKGIKVIDVGESQLYTGTGTTTFIPTQQSRALFKVPKNKLDSLFTKIEKRFTTGGDIIKDVGTPGESGTLLFKKEGSIQRGLSFGENRLGKVIRIDKPIGDKTLGFKGKGKKTPFSKTFGETEEVFIKETDLIAKRTKTPREKPSVTFEEPKPSMVGGEGLTEAQLLRRRARFTEPEMFIPSERTIQKGLGGTKIRQFKPEVIPKRRVGVVPISGIVPVQNEFNKFLEAQSNVLGQQMALSTDLTQAQNPLFDGKQDVNTTQTQSQAVVTDQFIKNRTEQGFITPMPKIQEPQIKAPSPFPLMLPGEEPRLENKQGYNAFVRRGKNYVQVNKVPLTEQSALSMASREVDNSASAQFKVKKAKNNVGAIQDTFGRFNKVMGDKGDKMKAKVLNTQDKYFANTREKYREYKVSRGKKKNLPTNRYIEKSKYRIDTRGEKSQITSKGIATPKTRKKKKQMFRL